MKKKEMTGEEVLRSIQKLREISKLYQEEYESIIEVLNDPIESVIISGDEIDAYEDRLIYIEKFLEEAKLIFQNCYEMTRNELLRKEMLASGQLN